MGIKFATGFTMPAALNAEETENVRRGEGEGLRASVPPRPPREASPCQSV